MAQMVGGVLSDHRRFVREELERIAAKSGEGPPIPLALSGPEPMNGSASPPPDRAQLQTWVSQQLDAMNRQRATEWAEIVEKLKGFPPGG
jgi:hypothetical protein